MFTTEKSNQYTPPFTGEDLTTSYWHATELAINKPWFIAKVLDTEGTGENTNEYGRTLLLSNIKQIRQLLEKPSDAMPRLLKVDIVTPDYVNGSQGWKIDRLIKVWSALEPQAELQRALVYETDSQVCYCESLLDTEIADLHVDTLIFELPNLTE